MRKRRKKSNKQDNTSMIGKIIDLPIEEFNKQIVDQNLSVGVLQNVRIHLQCTYDDLRQRKDAIIKQVGSGELEANNPDVKKALEGCYSEMMKIEDKVLNLSERITDLMIRT